MGGKTATAGPYQACSSKAQQVLAVFQNPSVPGIATVVTTETRAESETMEYK